MRPRKKKTLFLKAIVREGLTFRVFMRRALSENRQRGIQ